jgi:glycyl-tRNA synthetase beta chain
VKEFTELQGVMGREYARLSGENPLVAEAIFEHYLPRFAGDVLPKTIGGKLVGVADKLDTIVGTFSRGLIPTGSQDPYALRRQALGIVNIIIDSRFHISFTQLIYAAMDLLQIKEVKREKLQINLQEFFQLRLRNILADQGVRYDIVDAVLAEGSDDIYATYQRAHALATFLEAPNFGKTLMAYTRVLNLAKKANAEYGIDSALFQDAAEISLYKVYQDTKETILRATETRDYAGALVSLTALQAPIDTFFAAVMVMVEDEKVKQNRLALLKSIAGLMDGTADLSKIVV